MKHSLILFACLVSLAVSSFAQKTMPAFAFTDLEGNSFTHADLQPDLATIFIFFDPYCDHCEHQAEMIQAAEADFKNVQIVFVTTEPEVAPTEAFMNKMFGNTTLEHVHFLLDTDYMFDAYFDGYYEVPSVLVYDKEKKHKKTLNKETPAADLLKHL